jgi:hypothetical protein
LHHILVDKCKNQTLSLPSDEELRISHLKCWYLIKDLIMLLWVGLGQDVIFMLYLYQQANPTYITPFSQLCSFSRTLYSTSISQFDTNRYLSDLSSRNCAIRYCLHIQLIMQGIICSISRGGKTRNRAIILSILACAILGPLYVNLFERSTCLGESD